MKTAARRPASTAGRKATTKRASHRRRIVRLVVAVVLVVGFAPVVLVPAYLFVDPVSTLMVATRITDGPVRREWVAFDDVAPSLVVAVMASEDARFCDHAGVDWAALDAVIEQPGGPTRGASTIAMQTVRNLFLWTSRSYIRKALELPLALYADLVWPKRRMMEIYLNIAEWGPGIFGIGAAAEHYFGRSAGALSEAQSALLAVALPNPRLRNPARPTGSLQSLARRIEARARQSAAYTGCLYP